MKVESSAQLLLPTVAYGNLTLFHKVTLDTATDVARIEEAAKEENIRSGALSTENVQNLATKMALKEVMKMKSEVDALTSESFQLSNSKR